MMKRISLKLMPRKSNNRIKNQPKMPIRIYTMKVTHKKLSMQTMMMDSEIATNLQFKESKPKSNHIMIMKNSKMKFLICHLPQQEEHGILISR
jgi:hypothetical protein